MKKMEMQPNKYSGKIGMQYKTFSVASKEVQYNPESRIISGYAAIFGNKDKADDILVKGCFAKSIQEHGPESGANDKIAMIWMHDMKEPIGSVTVLKEDDHGLYFESRIDEIELGDRVIKQLESGTLNQFSIGYQYIWDNCEWDPNKEALIVREVKLYEISVVTIGCNGETEYLGLKSLEDYDNAYEKLLEEISELGRNLSSHKQRNMQKIIAKAMSLAANKPELLDEAALYGGKADTDSEKSEQPLYKLFKLKSV